MAIKCKKYILFCACLVFSYVLGIRGDLYSSPQILASPDPVVDAYTNYSVFCQGNRPLTWTWPEVEDEKSTWTTFRTVDEKPTDRSFKYGKRLFIENITYPFVGFYRCRFEDTDPSSDNGKAEIYIFVNDTDHLSVSDTDTETVHAVLFQEATIPCRPTAPDVAVHITNLGGEEVEMDKVNDLFGSYRYEIYYGYFTNDTRKLTSGAIFICTFTRGNIQREEYVVLMIENAVPNLPKPQLVDDNEGHTNVGDTLNLTCTIYAANSVQFHWFGPIGPLHKSDRIKFSDQAKMSDSEAFFQKLSIRESTLQDKGIYTCKVTDLQNHTSSVKLNVTVWGANESYISLRESTNQTTINERAGRSNVNVTWAVDVEGHPKPTITWINNKGQIISEKNTKYITYSLSHQSTLIIKDIKISDFGTYKIIAKNKFREAKLEVFLNITDEPTVFIKPKLFHLIGKPTNVTCEIASHPPPQVFWKYTPSCGENNVCSSIPLKPVKTTQNGFKFTSTVTLNASESGSVSCFAKNSLGEHETVSAFYVTDVKDGFDLFVKQNNIEVVEYVGSKRAIVAVDSTVSIICAAHYNYSNIEWIRNNQILHNDYGYKIEKQNTEYSNRTTLTIPHTKFADTGFYSCRVRDGTGNYLYKNISLNVDERSKPIWRNTNMKKNIEMELPDKLELFCIVGGVPKPSVQWFKDGAHFYPGKSNQRITIDETNEIISFSKTNPVDEGEYKCEAANGEGVISHKISLKFKNNPVSPKWPFYVSAVLAVLFIVALIYIIIKIKKEKNLQRELKKIGLLNFERGAVENLNPELGIDEQAELLPYDKKWEFPIEKLKLGKQLGSGAFGVVMKGEAKHIVGDEDTTIVAVKMVKKNADYTYIKALASELKIMVHLGKHLNVVNLLGACTKNVAKKELLVIVEYCRFGNLQNYLLRHRDNFIDQVDQKTGKLDYAIGQDILERTYSVSSESNQSPPLKYAALTFSNSSNNPSPPQNMQDYRGNDSVTSAATDMTTVTQGDEITLSNNSVQPEWRSNYKGDYKGNVKPICTKDLLAWTFQVARGMEYLASRKVLHGDLAARNILLAENNVVKICDFGLAKSMYKSDNYKKRGDVPMPIKWMAIESIRDRVFSTQSDVWSFGIVLWEFFSLGRTPYPGMVADERLFNKLVDGYRMESPPHAPKEIYKMMTDCWQAKPTLRPSFSKLSENIGNLVENSLRKHYIDLNDPYLVMNTNRLEDGHNDYLAMLSPPTFENLASPEPHHYVNDMVVGSPMGSPLGSPIGTELDGYLCMKPNTIFSPRLVEQDVFDFNVNNRKNATSSEGNGHELLPMLHGTHQDSDSETPMSPVTPSSYSNPSYHVLPKVTPVDNDGTQKADVIKSEGNYVNMPQCKQLITDKIPFVNLNNEKADAHYVNSHTRNWDGIEV